MKKLWTYFIVSLLIVRVVIWYSAIKFRDDINTIIETIDFREFQIDSLRTSRILLEESAKEETNDALSNKNRIQNLKIEERKLLENSLVQLIEAKNKTEAHLKFLDTVDSVVTTSVLLILGVVVFKLIRTW